MNMFWKSASLAALLGSTLYGASWGDTLKGATGYVKQVNTTTTTLQDNGVNIDRVTQLNDNTSTLRWTQYDFVAGSDVIFEDTLLGERNGDFPSQWELLKGSIENASLDQKNVLFFIQCNVNGGGCIVPKLPNSSEDYLPEVFTIEFDAYFEHASNGKGRDYTLYLIDTKNQQHLDKTTQISRKWIRVGENGAEYAADVSRKYYPGLNANSKIAPGWRHVAISWQHSHMRVYLDDARVINVPNMTFNPTGVSFGFHNPSGGDVKGYVRNFRIAQGVIPSDEEILRRGKWITRGLHFESGSATLQPQSMGVLNQIVGFMQRNPRISLSVEGHTDTTGELQANLELSQKRALAIKVALVGLGVDASRLKTQGWGATKPLYENTTVLGRANNRRVEFVIR